MAPSSSSPAAASTSSGDATRAALVEAAVELFGEQGYHATSIRELADSAQVNSALIGYHFGGKKGLYLAVFEHIADRIAERIGPLVETIEADLERFTAGDREKGREPSERLLPLLQRLLDGFVALITSNESASWARLIVREQQDPTDAFDLLYDRFMERVLSLVTRLVAELQTTTSDRSETPTRRDRLMALTLVGQALVFRVGRAAVLRHLRWDEIGADEIVLVQRQIRRNVDAMLSVGGGGGTT